eukprot:2055455-Prymnesium_polylepis.1
MDSNSALAAALSMPEDVLDVAAFLRKVGMTLDAIASAEQLKWSNLDLDDDDLKAAAELTSRMP